MNSIENRRFSAFFVAPISRACVESEARSSRFVISERAEHIFLIRGKTYGSQAIGRTRIGHTGPGSPITPIILNDRSLVDQRKRKAGDCTSITVRD